MAPYLLVRWTVSLRKDPERPTATAKTESRQVCAQAHILQYECGTLSTYVVVLLHAKPYVDDIQQFFYLPMQRRGTVSV